MKTPLNIGLVGYGYWGPNLARVFSEQKEARLHTLCDKSYERLRSAKSKFPSLNTCLNYEELLHNPEIDAVVIATPVSTHAALARRALLAGKHVHIEKPMCMKSRDAVALEKLARQKKKVLIVGHTFLYSPPVRKIKEIIDEGTLGRIYYINSSRVNLGLFQPDVSVFYDLMPHDLSILLYWLGTDPLWACAQGVSFVRKNIMEVGWATLAFPRGVMAHLHVSWLAPTKLRHTTIVGAKRMVLYDDAANNEKVKIFDQGVVKNPETFGEFQLTYRSGDVLSPHIDTSEPLRIQAQAFIDAMKNGERPASDARFGARVVKVLEAVEASAKRKGKVIWLR